MDLSKENSEKEKKARERGRIDGFCEGYRKGVDDATRVEGFRRIARGED